jgi:hypothetical protein
VNLLIVGEGIFQATDDSLAPFFAIFPRNFCIFAVSYLHSSRSHLRILGFRAKLTLEETSTMKFSLLTSLGILLLCSSTNFAQMITIVNQLPKTKSTEQPDKSPTKSSPRTPVNIPTQAPKPKKQPLQLDWKSLGIFAALQASTAADLESTFRTLNRCSTCYEANPIMRPLIKAGRPTSYAVITGINTLGLWTSLKLRQEKKKWWWVPMTVYTGIHVFAAVHNNRIL